MKKNKLTLFFQHFEEIFASIFIIITTVLVLINVFLRYFMKTGLPWTEEVTTGCFVWSVFLGSAAGYKRKMHVSVDTIVKHAKGKVRKAIQLAVDIFELLLTGFITYMAIAYILISKNKPTPVLGISTVYISSSILVSFILMTLYSLRFVYQDIRSFNTNDTTTMQEVK